MTSEDTLTRFIKYSESLTESCIQNPKIIGLVLVGSTAETERVDQWSDHDFFVLTEAGDQEALRQDLSWLPNAKSIAFWFRETEHGLKVVYDTGDVLEFAIFDCNELSGCMVNHHRLAYGHEDVKKALDIAKNRLPEVVVGDDLADFHHFLSVLVIQVGRARRGEILTAGQGIRGTAATALLKVFTRRLPSDTRLDKLDVSRRFEFAHPKIGKLIAEALEQDPESAARELLEISIEHLEPLWNEYPMAAVHVVKDVLSWTS
jgi:hypothetical protein